MNPLHLSARFAEAGLALDVLDVPIDRGRGVSDVKIVQMDIARGAHGERFRIFPGTGPNRLAVTTYDKRQQQLVMFVDEPRQRFEATVPRFARVLEPGTRVVFQDRTKRVVEQFTPARRRHFLCGMDESHLFIAQLPRAASTVRDAQRSLAPEIPREYRFERHARRQGEWFFFPATPSDERELAPHLRFSVRVNVGIAQAANLRRAGRQHIASEVCVVGMRIFARGRVRHPDHQTIELRGWHRVLPNAEAFDQPPGVLWVD